MADEILVYIGGAYQVTWIISHLMFPRIFDWPNTLAKLDDFNRYLMLIFSKLLLVFYLGTTVICFVYADDLLDTNLGLAILIFLAVYWLVRALLQVQYFGFERANSMNVQMSSSDTSNKTISIILFFIFLTGTALFLAPVLITKC